MTLLALRDVVAVRGGRTLFGPIDLVLEPGDAMVVTGPNGVGKTSLLRIAAGLLVPAAGSVARGGDIAFAGEALALDAERTLGAALRFWAGADDRPDPDARVEAALARFGIASLAQVPVRLLSTGQRRRGALARVAASGAPLWLLDEPGNGLDAVALELLETAIAAHRADGGAVMLATHQPFAISGARSVALG